MDWLRDFIVSTALPWVLNFLAGNPTLGPILIVLIFVQGLSRIFFKPINDLIGAYVASTASPDDDIWWIKIQESKWYKTLAWVINWLCSLKLPTPKG